MNYYKIYDIVYLSTTVGGAKNIRFEDGGLMKIRGKCREILEDICWIILCCISFLVYHIDNVYCFFRTIYYARKQGRRYRDFVGGIRAGEKRFGRLSLKLIADGRYEDLQMAVWDVEYRTELYLEYKICQLM